MKKLLIMLHQTPYRDTHTIEMLETAMVGAVFDFQVSLLLRADSVWGLVPGQDAGLFGRRSVGKVLGALPTYEVTQVYACSEALARANLADADLVVPVEQITPEQQAALIADQDLVVGA